MKKILIIGIMGLIFLALAQAIPVPHGIDGRVYALDGITPANVNFSVNVVGGEFIQGKTKNGKYSVSLNSNDGSTVIISAWNDYHSSNRTVVLSGVMHNVDLLINTTPPATYPNITSTPINEAVEDVLYTYNVVAEDGSNMLSYNLAQKPSGMTIQQFSGNISWVPSNDDVGNHSILVQVSNEHHTVNQSFVLTVIGVNDAPEIVSSPVTSVSEDDEYIYDVDAVDVDSGSLFYGLDLNPIGMQINTSSGVVQWTPVNEDVGNHLVAISVSDGSLNDSQQYNLTVNNTNDEFIINSTPVTLAFENEIYLYDVDAYDIDQDELTYSLVMYPSGMEINTSSGLITWIPQNSHVGNNSVVVEVSDSVIDENHSFVITVIPDNNPPIFHSSPVREARVYRWYRYDVNATDPDDDDLTFSLLEKPSNMFMWGNSGRIRWFPLNRHIGNNSVVVEVSDGNNSVIQEFDILVKRFTFGSSETQELDLVSDSELISESSSGTTKTSVKELGAKPVSIRGLDKKVYRYLDIKNAEDRFTFSVPKEWLAKNQATKDNLQLFVYEDNNWDSVLIDLVENKEDSYVFEALVQAEFAAIALDSIGVLGEIVETGPKEAHVISGSIFKNNKSIGGVPVKLKNIDSGNIYESQTGPPGMYYFVVNGKIGDLLEIEAGKGLSKVASQITLQGDMKNINLVIGSSKLDSVTGNVVKKIEVRSVFLAMSLLFTIVALVFFIFVKKRKE